MKHIPSFDEFINESSSNIKAGDTYAISKKEKPDNNWSSDVNVQIMYQTMEPLGTCKVDTFTADPNETTGNLKVPGKFLVYGHEIKIIKPGSKNTKVEIKGAIKMEGKNSSFWKGTAVCTIETYYIDKFLKSKYLV